MKESQLSKAPIKDNRYYYHQLPEGVRRTITYEQEREILKVIQRAIRVPSKKLISIELTFTFFKRFYLVWYLGRDLRNRPRYSSSNKQNFMRITVHFICTCILWLTIGLTAALALYELKTLLDIDIFPDQHTNEFILDGLKSSE